MIPKRHTALISKCAMYAHNAYSNDIDGLVIAIEDKDTDAKAFVAFDKESGDIIITGQGTTTLRDWSIDFQFWRTSVDYLEGTKVHAGFMKQYNAIRDEMHSSIKDIMTLNECSRIICCGHSLFGAVSTVAALDCALLYDLPVHCVSFGSPRVGARDFVKLFNNSVDISYRCVRYKDPVTFTPLPIRFKHVRGGTHFSDSKTADANVALYNCCGCRVKHHYMEDYAAYALEMMK